MGYHTSVFMVIKKIIKDFDNSESRNDAHLRFVVIFPNLSYGKEGASMSIKAFHRTPEQRAIACEGMRYTKKQKYQGLS